VPGYDQDRERESKGTWKNKPCRAEKYDIRELYAAEIRIT
jgi:hypothetical protein